MMPSNPLGSIWRQWDLHFHTPASYDYENKGVTDEEIVEGLVAAGVSVVAITDHHVIDVNKIRNLQQIAGERLTIFPGIELRSELGGQSSVHFIAIFPADCPLDDVWTTLQGQLHLTPTDVEKMGGDEKVYVAFRETAKVVRELNGLISAHGGRKSNSVEEISNKELFKQALKTDLLTTAVDLLDIGRLDDFDDYHDIVFPNIGKILPLLICSDNHNIKSYERREICWIKSDPTFAGLRQVLNEPTERVFLGDTPPCVLRVARNKTKYMRSVSLKKSEESTLDEAWFDESILLNSGLIAIIGNKGSGKSALADTIGLLGDAAHSDVFSFLNPDKFRSPKANKASHFTGTLEWESNRSVTKSLDDDVDPTAVESVKYIPQRYLETICNELTQPSGSQFDQELKGVIFSHVADADRLGCDSLDALIRYKTEETEKSISLLTTDLREINERIIVLEEKLTPEFQKRLESLRDEKLRELEAHEKAKPEEISKPESDEKSQEALAEATKSIEAEQNALRALEEQIASVTEQRKAALRRLSVAEKLLRKLGNVEKQVRDFETDAAEELTELSLSVGDILAFEIKRSPVEQIQQDAQKRAKQLEKELNVELDESLANKKAACEQAILILEAKLDEPNKKYQAYLKALADWTSAQEAIVGNEDAPKSLRYYERQLKELEAAPSKLREADEERRELTRQIYAELEALAATYGSLYDPVQKFVEEHKLAQDQFDLSFDVTIVDTGFEDQFFDFINQARRGSFHGVDEGRRALRKLLRASKFDTWEGTLEFLDAVTNRLRRDNRDDSQPPVLPASQLRKERTIEELYEFLFSLNFLRPRYSLRWGGKDIGQLSPGERGTLLLVFYLLIDKGDIPLIIDQPDDNLDNQTVVEVLVPCIKEVKTKRQIVIVTHNPNLAVVCDAEQVIAAAFDKAACRITYTTGAIENPAINKRIVDILEGTRPAFDNRDAKYQVVLPYDEAEVDRDDP
jgi:ABC-type lipoprotein export system ATPase subunit